MATAVQPEHRVQMLLVVKRTGVRLRATNKLRIEAPHPRAAANQVDAAIDCLTVGFSHQHQVEALGPHADTPATNGRRAGRKELYVGVRLDHEPICRAVHPTRAVHPHIFVHAATTPTGWTMLVTNHVPEDKVQRSPDGFMP